MTQSFPGRQKHVVTSTKVRAQDNTSRANTSWSDRQSKDARLAAQEKAKKDALELKQIKEARKELPHLLNRSLII